MKTLLHIVLFLSIIANTLFVKGQNNVSIEDSCKTEIKAIRQVPKRTIDKYMSVGTIKGEADVLPTGAASYQVTVETPKGFNGLEPHISFAYNSQTGNGIMGYGWNLSATSVIRRCSKNRYYDNRNEEIKMDDTDALELDGQRLILLAGNNLEDRALYALENDNITRITCRVINSIPLFIVNSGDGETKIYSVSCTTKNGEVLSWLLSSVSDKNENKLTYSYIENKGTGAYCLSRIDYSGTESHILFSYEDRPDSYVYYVGGEAITNTKRLTGISCYVGNEDIYPSEDSYILDRNLMVKYTFNYDYDGYYSKLTSICKNDNSSGYPPTDIYYNGSREKSEEYVSLPKKLNNAINIFADFDGDGIPEYVSYEGKYSYSNNDIATIYKLSADKMFYYELSSVPLCDGFKRLFVADLNGDGKKDLVRIGQGKYSCYFSTGNGFFLHKEFYSSDETGMASDFDGDGKDEILLKNEQKLYDENATVIAEGGIDNWGEEYIPVHYPNNLFFCDINGNGKTDILCTNRNGAWFYELQDNHFVRLYDFETNEMKNITQNACGDFNGDGKTDFFVYNKQENYSYLLLSTGKGFVKQYLNISTPVKVGDFNRDGKADIFYTDINGTYPQMFIGIFDGSKFNIQSCISQKILSNKILQYLGDNNDYHLILTDFDGDGRSEFCTLFPDAIIVNTFEDKQDLLATNFVNGLNKNVSFDYNVLTSIGLCNISNDNTIFPVCKAKIPLLVVTSMMTGGFKLTETKNYEYTDPCFHIQGKGFLGFSQIGITNYMNNTKTLNTYEYDNPIYHTFVKEQLVYNFRNGGGIKDCIYENDFVQIETGYIPYIKSKTETDYLKKTTIITTDSIDKYGNTILSVVKYGNKFEEITRTEYKNGTDNLDWIFGLPTSIEKSIYNGIDNWKEKQIIDYDEKYRPKRYQKFVGSQGNNKISEDIYSYDSYGNRIQTDFKPFSSEKIYTTKYSYDKNKVISVTDRYGLTTSYKYNLLDDIRYIYRPDGSQTRFTYDIFGRHYNTFVNDEYYTYEMFSWGYRNTDTYFIERGETDKLTTKTIYDGDGRERRIETQRYDESWTVIDKEYDYNGRLWRTSLPYKSSDTEQKKWNTYTYDDFGRIVKVCYASGKTEEYSYEGNTIKVVSNGITTTKTYDEKGNIIKIVDPSGEAVYTLRADGQIASVTLNGKQTTCFEYDNYGRKICIKDKCAGIRRYVYDEEGNLSEEVMADGNSVKMKYDDFGRLLQKTTNEMSSAYYYDSCNRLISVKSNNGTETTYQYNEYGYLTNETKYISPSVWFSKTYTYENGLVQTIDYATSSRYLGQEKRIYAFSYGILCKLLFNGTEVWSLDKENELGQCETETTGPTVRHHIYTDCGIETGILLTIGDSIVTSSMYEFNPKTENMNWREDKLYGIKEKFSYDEKNRLIAYGNKHIDYDCYGNIINKTDVGQFVYDSNDIYHLNHININFNPSLPTLNQQINYTSFQRPSQIINQNTVIEFTYNDNYDRCIMTVKEENRLSVVKNYFSEEYEEKTDMISKEKTGYLYIGGDTYSAPVVLVIETTGDKLYYIGRDILGSITHIFDNNGKLVYEYSYDAWGRLRNPKTLQVYACGDEPELFLGRGYCGHEHLQKNGLINMNARLYSPVIGRFVSPDPNVQNPYENQNFNRYAYCVNNPLKYVDKDGEFWWLIPIFAVGNTLAHWIRGDIHNFGDALKFLGQGALVGAGLYGLGFIPYIGSSFALISKGYMYTQAGLGAVGMTLGALNGGFKGVYNGFKIFLGNFYLDENSYWGGVIQGISRHSWEMLQTGIGSVYSQVNNVASGVDRVDYLGGATFSIIEHSDIGWGITFGNYINIKDKHEITGSFDDYILNNPVYRHEYGHTIDSRILGPAYLFTIGIPSIISASKSKSLGEPPYSSHRKYWTEIRANHHAKSYFEKYFKYKGFYWDPYEREFPTN